MSVAATAIKNIIRHSFRMTGYDIHRIGISDDPYASARALLCDRAAPIVFDVGANIGQTVTRVLTAIPNAVIHCFEPDPATFAQLISNTSSHPEVHCHQTGVAETAGQLQLRINQSSGTNSFLSPSTAADSFSRHPDYSHIGLLDVEIVTLQQFCDYHCIPRVDLLKIDTQGYELKILKGAAERLTPKFIHLVLLEVNFVPLYDGQPHFDELCAMLRVRGYKLVDLYDREVHGKLGLIQANALFKPA